MSNDAPIRICLVEDHVIVRSGLKLLLNGQPDMEVVAEAVNRTEALQAASTKPNMFLVDVDLNGENAVDFLKELLALAPDSHAILLTGITDDEQLQRGVIAGATGLVYKDEATDVLIHAIRKVHSGEAWLGRTLTAAVLARLSRSHGAPQAPRDPEFIKISTLTRREREVVSLIATGSNRKTTAEKLFISEATVRNHLTSILAKLNLNSKFDLVFYAQRHGLIDQALAAEKVEI
jgi:DNA-binding NarL/FixJ family response regulator